jgi:uncharacterized membrane protein
MKRSLALILFYACAVLFIADAYAVASRFLGYRAEPDPVDWLKVSFALLIQLVAVTITSLYFWFLSHYDKPDTSPHAILDTLRLRFAPVLVAGLLAAFAYSMLYNGVNCGNHPFPINKGPTCPR